MGGARAWFAHPGALRLRLPLVLGLRLFPRSVGADELALAQRLSADPAAARAAFLLRTVHGLPLDAVHDLLESADAPDPAAALRSAGILAESSRRSPAALLPSQEFDDCALQAGPTDLLRRIRRTRLLLAAAAIGLVTVVTLAVAGDGTARRIRARRTSPDGRPARATAACSRFGQHVVAASGRRSPNGHWYAPSAGSRAVTSPSVSGDVTATKQSRTLAVPAPRASPRGRALPPAGDRTPSALPGPESSAGRGPTGLRSSAAPPNRVASPPEAGLCGG